MNGAAVDNCFSLIIYLSSVPWTSCSTKNILEAFTFNGNREVKEIRNNDASWMTS